MKPQGRTSSNRHSTRRSYSMPRTCSAKNRWLTNYACSGAVECGLQRYVLHRGERMKDAESSANAQGEAVASSPRRPREETARLGDEIYERDIRPEVEANHRGEVVAIDVESGSWAVGANVIAATDQLRAQCPGAIDVWLLRVGHRALHHFGGRSLRRAE